jgi:hypothetical protein
MNISFIRRHPCCDHRPSAASHGGWLAAIMVGAVLAASMVGAIKTIDQLIWGQAYKQQVIEGSLQRTPEERELAGYGSAEGARFRPVSDRIFGH